MYLPFNRTKKTTHKKAGCSHSVSESGKHHLFIAFCHSDTIYDPPSCLGQRSPVLDQIFFRTRGSLRWSSPYVLVHHN